MWKKKSVSNDILKLTYQEENWLNILDDHFAQQYTVL